MLLPLREMLDEPEIAACYVKALCTWCAIRVKLLV